MSEQPDNKKMKVTQQIFHNLLEVVEIYPKYSICQHLSAILRRKDTVGKEFFFWSDPELLNKIEKYKSELEGEEFMNIDDNE